MTFARSRLAYAWRWLALTLLLAPTMLLAQTLTGVGFHHVTINDPVNGGTMPGWVFYPTTHAPGETTIGPYHVAATINAPAIPGAKPLVVISHGSGGSNLGHHELATYLASHGFIVATLEHPKDNFHDVSGIGHASVLVGRPIQVKATITTLLNDPHWKPLIDANRIGVAGFSAGGYASLLIIGAVPQFHRFVDFCNRHPNDQDICHDAKRLTAEAQSHGQTLEQMMDGIENQLTRWGDTADPRVKAAFVMAPLSLIFDEAGLAKIDRPVFLYYGQNDHVLIPKENAEHIRPLMKTLVDVKRVPLADHWVFLDPCSPELAKDAKDICSDPPGVDRVKVHQQIETDALTFFRKTLDVQTR